MTSRRWRMPVLVVVKHNRVVTDGQFVEYAVFQQHLDVAPHRSVADLGLDEKAVAVFPEFQRAADGKPAVVVQGQDFDPLPAFGDCLREGSGLYHIAAAVDVAIHGGVAAENTGFLLVLLRSEREGLVLGFHALGFHPFPSEASPCLEPPLGGIIKRRLAEVRGRKFRRQNGVVIGDVGVRARGAMFQLGVHPGGQGLQIVPFRLQVDACGGRCALGLFGCKFHVGLLNSCHR